LWALAWERTDFPVLSRALLPSIGDDGLQGLDFLRGLGGTVTFAMDTPTPTGKRCVCARISPKGGTDIWVKPCLEGKILASIVVPAIVKALCPNQNASARAPTAAAKTSKAIDLKPGDKIKGHSPIPKPSSVDFGRIGPKVKAAPPCGAENRKLKTEKWLEVRPAFGFRLSAFADRQDRQVRPAASRASVL